MNTILELGKDYHRLSDSDKKRYLDFLYTAERKSYAEIAEGVGTYTNKIRRDAVKLGIKSRNKSEAQSLALSGGRHKHPTKGTIRDEKTKMKIGEGVAKTWDNLSDEERERRSEIGREVWNQKTDEEKRKIHEASHKAILEAAKKGSKLELFLFNELLKAGYRTEIHKEQFIQNERLQIDLFLPELNVAIEVDGPSHDLPVWGEKVLRRNQRADREKNGLVLARGLVLIRVKHRRNLSAKRQRDLLGGLLEILKKIEQKFPPKNERLIIIGEING